MRRTQAHKLRGQSLVQNDYLKLSIQLYSTRSYKLVEMGFNDNDVGI